MSGRVIAGVLALALVLAIPFIDRLLPSSWACTIFVRAIVLYAIIGLGLNIVTGWTGLLNLGCAAFVGIGAYAYSVLTWGGYPFQFGFWPGLAAATVIGAGAGALIGLPTMRLRGDYLAIVTLGFGEIVQNLLNNLESITNGPLGLDPLPSPSLPWIAPPGPLASYYIALGLLLLALAVCWRLRHARTGRRWLAVRDDELAARACGVNVASVKLGAFALGASLCALGGGLMAAVYQSSSQPSEYGFLMSTTVVCLVILGGLGSLGGVLLGAAIVAGFNNLILDRLSTAIGSSASTSVFAQPNNWKYMAFGLALVLMMRFRPGGLLPERFANKTAVKSA